MIEQIIASGGKYNQLSQQGNAGKCNLRPGFNTARSEYKEDDRVSNCQNDSEDAGLLPTECVEHAEGNDTHEGKKCSSNQPNVGEK